MVGPNTTENKATERVDGFWLGISLKLGKSVMDTLKHSPTRRLVPCQSSITTSRLSRKHIVLYHIEFQNTISSANLVTEHTM